MNKFLNGKVYELLCLETGLRYIGSTFHELHWRLSMHVAHYKQRLAGGKQYTTSFEILKGGKYKMNLLEMVACNTREELHAREAHYIRTLPCVNKYLPCRTSKEYYLDHKSELLQKQKEYYELNKDAKKAYYQKNKETMKAKSLARYYRMKYTELDWIFQDCYDVF
jgi:hypothetical protein